MDMFQVKQKRNIVIISPPHIGPDWHIVQDCASVRGGIYPDDLLLFPLQLDELPSTRASGAAAVGLTTTKPGGCHQQNLLSLPTWREITRNDQDDFDAAAKAQ